MKQISSSLKNLVALLMFGALIVGLVFFFQAQQGQSGSGLSQPNQPCVPTPVDVSGLVKPGMDKNSLMPSVTPLPIAKITDFSAGADARHIAVAYIRRCNGTYEEVLIGPPYYSVPISNLISLGSGDIVNLISPEFLFAKPPNPFTPVPAGPTLPLATPSPIPNAPLISPLPSPVPNVPLVSPLSTPTPHGS